MPRLNDFSGGLNRRLHPTRVPPNQGVEFKNIDNTGGILQSAKSNRVITSITSDQQHEINPGNMRFTFYDDNEIRQGLLAITAAYCNPYFRFGPRKQYEISNFELQQAGRLFIQGDVNIPADENYRLTLTTVEENPSTITVITSDGTWRDPRDSSNNHIEFAITTDQAATFKGKVFRASVLPVSVTNTISRELDSTQVISRLSGKTFFREIGSSLVEQNGVAYFTRNGAPPQKVYGATRSFNSATFSVSSSYEEEQVQITGITGSTHQIINLKEDNTLEQIAQTDVPVPNGSFSAVFTRLTGNKLIHRQRNGLTRLVDVRSTDGIDYATRAPGVLYAFDGKLVNAESITNYNFFLTSTKKLYIGNSLRIDLSSFIPNDNTKQWRMSVLDYPINHITDPTKNNDQNLNLSRENIVQTRILLYTQDGVGRIISFTRDESSTGKVSIKTSDGTNLEDLTTDISPGIEGTNRHLLRGIDSNGNLNSFSNKDPLFAVVESAGDMTLLRNANTNDGITSIQIKRNNDRTETNNTLFVIRPVELGASTPTGYNTNSSISVYNVNRLTGAVSKINDDLIRCPILLDDIEVLLGYVGRTSRYSITTELDTSELIEDEDNLSLFEPIGITRPQSSLTLAEYDEFDNSNLRFPSAILVGVSSKYDSSSRVGGESTRPPRPQSRATYDHALDIRIRVVLNPKERIFRDLTVQLDDDALVAETKDTCRQKGSSGVFGIGNTLRTECQTHYTNLQRTGATLDFSNFYDDNAKTDVFPMDIGVEFGGTYYKVGTVDMNNTTVDLLNLVSYTNPNDLSLTATHERMLLQPKLADGSDAPILQTGAESSASSCSVRYLYVYYNALRNKESAPSFNSALVSVDARKPVRIEGFEIPPENSGVTHYRLFRTCPQKGEVQPIMIAQIPVTDEAPFYLDNLGDADLGGLKSNDKNQLIFEVRNPEDGSITSRPIIVNPDGTRHNPNDGFDEQWNNYLSATGKILDSQENLPPPTFDDEHINHFIKYAGRLIGIVGSHIVWSKAGDFDSWPGRNDLNFNDRITGIHPVQNGILAFTRNSTFLITNFANLNGSLPIITQVPVNQGCVSPRTVQDLRSIPTWISNDGVCQYFNSRVNVISRGLLGDDYLDGDIITTEVHNDVYYISYKNGDIVSMDQRYLSQLPSGEAAINTNFVVYDRNNVRWFETFDGEDVFYGVTDDNQIVEMFGGTDELIMSYTSPIITLIGEARVKRFSKLYIAYEDRGDLTVKSFLTGSTLRGEPKTTTHSTPSDRVWVERDFPKGTYYGVQFTVTGKGELSSIDFSALPGHQKPTG